MTLLAIMRPKDRLEESEALAEAMGFQVVCASPIDIEVRASPEFISFMETLADMDDPVVVFTSSTGVKAALEIARRGGNEAELISRLHQVTLVALGPVTARALDKEGLTAQYVPEEFTSEGILVSAREWGEKGRRCYVLRSDHGAGCLVPGLSRRGMIVQEIVVYALHRRPGSEELERLIDLGRKGIVDVYIFTSSLSARTLVESWAERDGLAEAVQSLNSKRIAAIGPPTRQVLESYGVRVDIMPVQATFAALLEAVDEAVIHGPSGGT